MKFSDIYLYQIVVVVISAIMIRNGIATFIKREAGQTFIKLAVRIAVWGGIAVVAAFPKVTNIFAEVIGLQGNINAVILTGFLMVFLMIFKLLSTVEKLEQNISKLTRKEALKDLKK